MEAENRNQKQRTLKQLEGYQTEQIPKQGNRNHQLERKQLESI
jgi:hypothetical protein